MNKKVKEWIKRYGPAEIVATITALLGATIAFLTSNNFVLTAFVGTWSENIGYYGFLSIRDIHSSKKKHDKNNMTYGIISFFKNIRSLVLEFGLAEVLDSFIVRPFTMYLFPVLLGNVQIGIFVGKIVADIIFYIPTIIAYELKKKHLKD